MVHPSNGSALLGYGALLGVIALLGLWSPLGALALSLAGLFAGLVDLDSGRSWLRSLVPRRISRTVVCWGGDPAGSRTLLIALPANAEARGLALSPLLPIAGGLVVFIGLITRLFEPEASLPFLGVAGGLALLTSLVGALRDARGRVEDGVAAARLTDELLRNLDEQPVPGLKICVGIFGGLSTFADGLETLLLNHRGRLDPTVTRVLVWSPAAGELRALDPEGRVQRRAADPLLRGLSQAAGLPFAAGTSAARRAQGLGWPAIGWRGPADALTEPLLALLRGAAPPSTPSTKDGP